MVEAAAQGQGRRGRRSGAEGYGRQFSVGLLVAWLLAGPESMYPLPP